MMTEEVAGARTASGPAEPAGTRPAVARLPGRSAHLAGEIRAKHSARTRASSARGRVAELIRLADTLCAGAGVARDAITQTVIGSPGVYDPRRGAMALTGGLAGLSRPAVLAGARGAVRPGLVPEKDGDPAAPGQPAPRPRPGIPGLPVRLVRHGHRPGPGPRRPAAPPGAR